MMEAGFYNIDCMDAMKEFPDGFFDLAIVDPPYGDGNASIGGGRRFGAMFDRYKLPNQEGGYHGKWPDALEPVEHGRRNSAKKLLRGTLPRGKNTSKSFSASRAIKLFGAEIILHCRQRDVFWCGAN